MVRRGEIYQHYKGNYYRVLEVAIHTETEEKLVVYCHVKEKKIWARPLADFEGYLTDGKKRFTIVEVE